MNLKIFFIIFILNMPSFSIAALRKVNTLEELQEKSLLLQKKLLDSLKQEQKNSIKLKQINELIALQKKEQVLARERSVKLEKFIHELFVRKKNVENKMIAKKEKTQKALKKILLSTLESPSFILNPKSEFLHAPRLKLLGKIVDQGFKDLEVLKIDLLDAQDLELTIQKEKTQLQGLLADLEERQELLQFHEKLQRDILNKNYQKRLAQLENYRELKNAQLQVEGLIKQFNSRLELETMIETKKNAPEIISSEAFLNAKGSLPFPLEGGRILSQFGRSLDTSSQLQVFKKGIEIQPGSSAQRDVKSVFPGKIVYQGELTRYGKVIIMDHGSRYFSLFGQLQKVYKKEGDFIGQGEILGDLKENQPLYFEIRSKNVAVDPMQWLLLASR